MKIRWQPRQDQIGSSAGDLRYCRHMEKYVPGRLNNNYVVV